MTTDSPLTNIVNKAKTVAQVLFTITKFRNRHSTIETECAVGAKILTVRATIFI